MKALIQNLLILTCVLTLFTMDAFANQTQLELESFSTLAIDSTDTVYFDLSKATLIGNQLTLPVNIMTNQPVNSLDFSFKYDHNELDYDTIINLTTYLQGLSFYNAADSTVRYTSSSFTAISVGINLVNVNFNLLSSQISGSDFNEVKGYLNGIKCTAIITNQLGVGISENHALNNSFTVYPNPASTSITLTSTSNDELIISDIQGRIVQKDLQIVAGEKLQLTVSDFDAGIYFIKSVKNPLAAASRVIVKH